MTKEQEIKFLTKVALKLGEASYFGPWLGQHMDDIIWAIKNDMPISTALHYNEEGCCGGWHIHP